MERLQVKIVNRSNNELPTYQTSGSVGMDLRAYLNDQVILEPLQRKLISTGLFIELPHGYEAQVRPRNGLALKQGLTVLNTPGTIDSDYRGEIGVILINLSNEVQTIKNGDRIAQMIFAKASFADLIPVDIIDESLRGAGGFAHTGIN